MIFIYVYKKTDEIGRVIYQNRSYDKSIDETQNNICFLEILYQKQNA